jgi:octaprenyl-diphosphate synthase
LQESEPGEGDLERAIAYMKRSGAIDETIGRARHYGTMACEALAIFPDGRAKSALLDAVEFCISRLH